MYFWNLRALKRDLVAATLTESQLFRYFLAVLMFEAALWQLLALFPSEAEPGLWEYLDVAAALVLTLAGTVIAYRVNGAGDGRNFLGRYFPIMWVLTVRFLAGLVPLMVVLVGALLVAGGWFAEPDAGAEDAADVMWAVAVAAWAITVLFYYRLAVHVRDVARGG
jgi:hypothetical protein